MMNYDGRSEATVEVSRFCLNEIASIGFAIGYHTIPHDSSVRILFLNDDGCHSLAVWLR